MYELNIDKPEKFECSVKVEGVNSSKTNARVILENENNNLVFYGTVVDGKCIVPFKNLRDFISEGSKGHIKLEVIADDVYFCPWESDYTAKLSRKVTVEMVKPEDSKPSIEVVVENTKENKEVTKKKKQIKESDNYIKRFAESLRKKGLTSNQIKEDMETKKVLVKHLIDKNLDVKSSMLEIYSILKNK